MWKFTTVSVQSIEVLNKIFATFEYFPIFNFDNQNTKLKSWKIDEIFRLEEKLFFSLRTRVQKKKLWQKLFLWM